MVNAEVVIHEYKEFANEISMKLAKVGCAVSLLETVECLVENIPGEGGAHALRIASESLYAAKDYLNLAYEDLANLAGNANLRNFD